MPLKLCSKSLAHRRTKSATRPMGTAISCLMLVPSLRCEAEMFSRNAHIWLRSCSLCANTLSVKPFSYRNSASCPLRLSFGSESVNSSRMCHSECVGRGRLLNSEDNSAAKRLISSKLHRRSAKCAWVSVSRRTADSMSGMPTHAVALSKGLANNLSVAAVIMPNVPSLPINKWRKS